jgi:predicted lipoprotein with Yx(FWY)xxD motif
LSEKLYADARPWTQTRDVEVTGTTADRVYFFGVQADTRKRGQMGRRATLIVSSALALIVLSPSLNAGAERGASGDAAVVKVAFNKKLKKRILVNAKGFTLYLFTEDAHGALACLDSYEHCPTAWPPLRSTEPPVAGKGVRADLLGTIQRPDGDPQVMYRGHPLYTDAGSTSLGLKADVKPGQIRGQAFFNVWFVVSPQGKAIQKSPR